MHTVLAVAFVVDGTKGLLFRPAVIGIKCPNREQTRITDLVQITKALGRRYYALRSSSRQEKSSTVEKEHERHRSRVERVCDTKVACILYRVSRSPLILLVESSTEQLCRRLVVMGEFGGKACFYPGCRQHDFLPLRCSACGLVFCTNHSAITDHDCQHGEAYLSSVSIMLSVQHRYIYISCPYSVQQGDTRG